MKKFLDIGMRTIKTVICVFACLILYEFISKINISNLPDNGFFNMIRYGLIKSSPSFACIAAVISLQDSMESTVEFGVSRIIGSLLGGGFATAFFYLNKLVLDGKAYILFAIIGTLIIICICNYKNQPVAVSISVITFLIVFIGTDSEHPFFFAVNRVTGTLIGVATAYLVNKYINPPRNKDKSSFI